MLAARSPRQRFAVTAAIIGLATLVLAVLSGAASITIGTAARNGQLVRASAPTAPAASPTWPSAAGPSS